MYDECIALSGNLNRHWAYVKKLSYATRNQGSQKFDSYLCAYANTKSQCITTDFAITTLVFQIPAGQT